MEGIIKAVTLDPVSTVSEDGVTETYVKIYFDANALLKMFEDAGYNPENVRTSYIFNDEGAYENRNITLKEAAETNHEVSWCSYIAVARAIA